MSTTADRARDHPVYDGQTARNRALRAGEKAMRLWPGAHGQVLCAEINMVLGHLHWLGPSALTWRLIDEILAAPEPRRWR
jgi:hypothetical protein